MAKQTLLFHVQLKMKSTASKAALVKNGVYCVAEGANMPSDLDTIKVYKENGVLYGLAKACERWWCCRIST
jgi:glutamate dehydrogenase/leucine dehydrogenase